MASPPLSHEELGKKAAVPRFAPLRIGTGALCIGWLKSDDEIR
jgi:hypothetical protein